MSFSPSQDDLMLSGDEAAWLELREDLPRLEALKTESGILQPGDTMQLLSITRHWLVMMSQHFIMFHGIMVSN